MSHRDFLSAISVVARQTNAESTLTDCKNIMNGTARRCVVGGKQWIIPSPAYAEYFFSRDSWWTLAALRDKNLSQMAVGQFAADQRNNANGQIATALRIDGTHPPNRDRDDESTLIYVLQNYLLQQLGGQPNRESMQRAWPLTASHINNGHYVTKGETRSGPEFGGTSQIGTYHCWSDTYRPAGAPVASPEVFGYNQGLLCVAMRCLQEMGIPLDKNLYQSSLTAYANLVSPADGLSLPQRQGSSNMDVSALVGEALSLYYFNTPLLSDQRVGATLKRLARVWYPDGKFLGFKVISGANGGFRPANEYSGGPVNAAGDYQRGASWFLYDVLALYAAARHGVADASQLFVERLDSERRSRRASHEFIKTGPTNFGQTDAERDGYGWNSFVVNLLP